MKKLSIVLMCLAVLGFTGTVSAGQPKTGVAHCGCNLDGTDLEWVFLDVSAKSKGHKQHLDGDLEDCSDQFEAFVGTYERDFNDCTLVGEGSLGGVVACDPNPVEGASCSD
jgi:hypothetical protein